MVVQGLIEEKVATRAEVLAIIKRGESKLDIGLVCASSSKSLLRSRQITAMWVQRITMRIAVGHTQSFKWYHLPF